MTAPSSWPRNAKLGLAVLAFSLVILSYAAMCAGVVQLAWLVR